MQTLKQTISDEPSMLAFGKALARALQEPAVIFFHGQLGAGKTTFIRGFLRGMGFDGLVKSPTYPLVESYEINHQLIYHFDFYRIKNAEELEWMGIQDYFLPQAICLVEWPEQGQGVLPLPDLSYYIEMSPAGREITIKANTDRGNHILKRLAHEQKE